MRRTKLTFTTSRPDEASPLVKYPFSWRASSFAGARQMGYYLRKVLFQSQGVIRISSAGRASSTRGGRKTRRRRWREEEDGPTNETTNRTSSLLCQKTFLSFSHSTYERIPSHEETMMIYPYNSAPSVRKDVFGERKQEIYIFSFPSFQFYFADLTIFIRVNGIYVYIYLEEIKGWWYWWKIYGSKFLLQNCGTLRSFVLGGGVSRAGSLFSVKGSEELERDVEGFKEGEEKVAGSSNAISYKRMIYSFAIVFLLPQSLRF